jgi:hypothetical protein
MDKKKIIWTLAALAGAGVSAYAIFHNCQKECFLCRYNLNKAITFTSGAMIGYVVYFYYIKN